jgi:hypothetical protein
VNRYYAAGLGAVAALIFAIAGCSSLVDDNCQDGYHVMDGVCMPDLRIHGFDLPDGGMDGPTVTAMPDARVIHLPSDGGVVQFPVCDPPTTLCGTDCDYLDSDPENCGHCGRECQSGICSTGTCVGDVVGHVVVIGHDYAASVPAMDRLVANAVHLGAQTSQVRVGYWAGDSSLSGVVSAVSRGVAQTGESTFGSQIVTITPTSIAEVDALVIEPQTGDGVAAEDAGTQAASTLQQYLIAGHSVVVLETTAGVGYRFLHGTGLGNLPAPVDCSSQQVNVIAPGDAVASGVVSAYLAKPGSVGYPGATNAVVTDAAADAVVIHTTY